MPHGVQEEQEDGRARAGCCVSIMRVARAKGVAHSKPLLFYQRAEAALGVKCRVFLRERGEVRRQ
jgi:hypothetical protein